jgi:hypothetical protein
MLFTQQEPTISPNMSTFDSRPRRPGVYFPDTPVRNKVRGYVIGTAPNSVVANIAELIEDYCHEEDKKAKASKLDVVMSSFESLNKTQKTALIQLTKLERAQEKGKHKACYTRLLNEFETFHNEEQHQHYTEVDSYALETTTTAVTAPVATATKVVTKTLETVPAIVLDLDDIFL